MSLEGRDVRNNQSQRKHGITSSHMGAEFSRRKHSRENTEKRLFEYESENTVGGLGGAGLLWTPVKNT
jgi:hypothetical protein